MSEKKVPEFGIRHLPGAGLEPEAGLVIKTKVWLEKDGKLLMGRGRATLLERIDQMVSISAAARSMKLAYRNAWLWVEAMNRTYGAPLVEKATGGRRGGNSRLTEAGRQLVREYLEKRTTVYNMLKKQP